MSGSIRRGAKGWYTIGPDGRPQIVALQNVAKQIKISAPSCQAAGGSFTVSACTVLDDGQDPTQGGLNAITITNWGYLLCGGQSAVCVPDGSGVTGHYLVLSALRLAPAISGTAPSTTAAGGSFTVSACTVEGEGVDPTTCGGGTVTVNNWNQQLCSGSGFVAILSSASSCSGIVYRVIDGDCPPSGGCSS